MEKVLLCYEYHCKQKGAKYETKCLKNQTETERIRKERGEREEEKEGFSISLCFLSLSLSLFFLFFSFFQLFSKRTNFFFQRFFLKRWFCANYM